MPKFISETHQDILLRFFYSQRTTIMHHLLNIWAIDYEKNLFSMLMAMKLYISKEGLSVVGMLKRINDADYLVVNKLGEVGGMGWKIRRLFNLTSEDLDKGLVMNIMSICPAIIPGFLRELYQEPGFDFEDNLDLEKKEVKIDTLVSKFNKMYFFFQQNFTFKNQKLGDTLKTIKQRSLTDKESTRLMLGEYSNAIHEFLHKIQTKDIERAYKVWARVTNMKFYSNNIDAWEIKIENIQRVKEDCLRT